MNLMPPDSISQAGPRAVPNQNSRRRSCGLCYIYENVGRPQGGQYSTFLPESCSIDPSNVWLGRLKNDQLEQWKRQRSNIGGKGYRQRTENELSKRKSALKPY